MVQHTKVRERISTVCRCYTRQIVRSHACKHANIISETVFCPQMRAPVCSIVAYLVSIITSALAVSTRRHLRSADLRDLVTELRASVFEAFQLLVCHRGTACRRNSRSRHCMSVGQFSKRRRYSYAATKRSRQNFLLYLKNCKQFI